MKDDTTGIRVLIVSSEYPPVPGGIARAIKAIEVGLRGVGCEIRVIGGRSGRSGRLAGLILQYLRTRKAVKEFRPQVILAGKWTRDGLPTLALRRTGGPPFIVMVHGTELPLRAGPSLRSWLARKVFAGASVAVTNSGFTEDLLRKILHRGHAPPVHRFSALFDPDSVEGDAGPPPPAIRNLPADSRLMLTVARLVPRKGHARVLEVLSILKDEFPCLHYAFTGGGPMARELLSLAANMGITERVHPVGWVGGEKLASLYRAADLLVGLGSEDAGDVEGLGLAFIEAGYFGLPAVAGRTGGVEEVIEDGRTGFLVDPEQPQEAATRIRELLRDEDRHQRMGRAARKRVDEHFVVHRRIGELVDLLKAAAGRGPSERTALRRSNVEEIRKTYKLRESSSALYSKDNRWHREVLRAREDALLPMLEREGLRDLSGLRILDLGCGRGGWLKDLIRWGADPALLFGVDLIQERLAEARREIPGELGLALAAGEALPYPDAILDMVIQATVFSSVLDQERRTGIAREVLRVLRPGGVLLWNDFRWNNPRNRRVRKVSRAEIESLFPGCSLHLERVTVAPPLGRAVAPLSVKLYHFLERIPLVCSHYLGLIRRPEA